MKRALIVAALGLSAAGCASTPGTYSPATDIDVAYVGLVESAAQRNGAKVIWLQYPTRRSQAAATEPARN